MKDNYCDDCGCRVYNGHCVNCHEDVYIAEQHFEQGSWDECSDVFKEKVLTQLNNPRCLALNKNDHQ